MCVCVCVGCADLTSLDTLSPQERKRQGYIHELIETEQKYVDDLQLVLEVCVCVCGLRPGVKRAVCVLCVRACVCVCVCVCMCIVYVWVGITLGISALHCTQGHRLSAY